MEVFQGKFIYSKYILFSSWKSVNWFCLNFPLQICTMELTAAIGYVDAGHPPEGEGI